MELHPLYEEFLTYLAVERNCSPLTISAYRDDARSLFRHLEAEGIAPNAGNITRLTVRGYIAWLRGRGLSPTTVARRIHSLRSFWNYLWDSDYVDTNPFRKISLPKQSRALPVYLSVEEASRLVAAAGAQKAEFYARRDRAVLSVLLFTGARRSELLNLQWDDVDMQGETVRFVGAKGDKTRVVPMAAQLLSDLLAWQEVRQACQHRYVFTSKSGTRLGKRGLQTALTWALRVAGIDKPGITTHKLRHTFACMMLRGGADLSCLQRMMGHSRLDTTGIYLSATAEDLKEAMGRHPLSVASTEAFRAGEARHTIPHLRHV
ncbi:MAG: tyrosine-type recombinase/integrase [Armatimonadia bacterium]